MDCQMFLEAVGHHWVLAEGMFFTPLTDVHFCKALQVDMLEGSGRKCKLRDMAGDGWSPLQHYQGGEVSKGASNDLRGTCWKRHLHFLWSQWCCGCGGMVGSLWGWPKWSRSPLALHTRGRSPRGGRSWLRLCRPWWTWGPLTGWQGYPPWPTPAPGVPFFPGGLHSA